MSKNSSGGGCGCASMILSILALWALWFGLPTPWGVFNVDLFPPAIRQLSTRSVP